MEAVILNKTHILPRHAHTHRPFYVSVLFLPAVRAKNGRCVHQTKYQLSSLQQHSTLIKSTMLTDMLFSPVAAVPLVIGLVFLYYTLPRKASNSDAPPMVKSSLKIPLIGNIIEFGMSPVKMVFRCYADYGPVFTVPVSSNLLQTFKN